MWRVLSICQYQQTDLGCTWYTTYFGHFQHIYGDLTCTTHPWCNNYRWFFPYTPTSKKCSSVLVLNWGVNIQTSQNEEERIVSSSESVTSDKFKLQT